MKIVMSLVIGLVLSPLAVMAESFKYEEGTHYVELTIPVKVRDSSKIERLQSIFPTAVPTVTSLSLCLLIGRKACRLMLSSIVPRPSGTRTIRYMRKPIMLPRQ